MLEVLDHNCIIQFYLLTYLLIILQRKPNAPLILLKFQMSFLLVLEFLGYFKNLVLGRVLHQYPISDSVVDLCWYIGYQVEKWNTLLQLIMDATHSTVLSKLICYQVKIAVVWTQEVKCKQASVFCKCVLSFAHASGVYFHILGCRIFKGTLE